MEPYGIIPADPLPDRIFKEFKNLRSRLESAHLVIDNQRAELIECYEEIARLRNEAKAA